jgi:hypothetical protein
MVALALLLLPWVVALALVLAGQHLDTAAVGILAAVSIPLSGLWLAWAGYRDAKGFGTSGSGQAQPGMTNVGPGSLLGFAGVTGGQILYQRPAREGSPVSLAPRPAMLAGREDLLTDLDTRLSGGDSRGPRIVVLCGLGGAGKTSVAVEYAHRHLSEVDVAWQFPAHDPAVLAAEFGELAAQLEAQDLLDTRDPVASVHRVLAKFSAGWLLIFDNAADRASVERFLPPAGPGRVLITSQNPNWPPGQALDVPVLGTEVAADFLVNRTSDPDTQAAAELAAELGGLPLALEQAAAYMQAAGESLAGYLASFRQRRPDLLGRGEPTGYRGSVATTWALAFARLERSAPRAVGLLRLLAFCAPEAIPLRPLLQPRPGLTKGLRRKVTKVLEPLLEDRLAATDAIAALRRYSLISPATGGSVLVHRLVQAVTADQMAPQLAQAWRKAAAALVEATIPDDPQQPATWPVFAMLLPHTQAVLATDSASMDRIASYLFSSGNPVAARDLTRRVLDERVRVLGPEHLSTLVARANLAYFTGEAGDAAAARDQFAALLLTGERVLGPEHPNTLAVRGNLARWTGVAGDAAAARDQFAVLLPIEERVLGPEQLGTLADRAGLAYFTGDAGNAAAARDQLAALLPIEERVLGPEHPNTLSTRRNLARWTGVAGDAAAARDQFAALLPIEERVLGPEHPDTLATRGHIAFWTAEAGDAAAARDQYGALLPIRERVSGPEHPDSLEIRADLAYCTGWAGDAAAARDQFAVLAPIYERVLGPEHPQTLLARGNLARWTGMAGDAARARDQFAALLPFFERVLGPEHRDTLIVGRSLARWAGEAGDAARARDRFAAQLPIDQRAFGPEHPEVLAARAMLARWTGEAGDSARARDQLVALMPICERVLGPQHPDTVTTRSSLAYWTAQAEGGTGPTVD